MISLSHLLFRRTYPQAIAPVSSTFFASLVAITFLVSAVQETEANDLEALGFEIFINDPAEEEKKEEVKLNKELENLPDFIDPETWQEDLALDAPEEEAPKEPDWEAIYKTVELDGIGAEECCLRAARASRYQAEKACLSEGKKVWLLLSIRPDEGENAPDAKLGNCSVFNQNILEGERQNLISSMPSKDSSREEAQLSELDPYHCVAKAVAQCYDPIKSQGSGTNE